MTEAGEDQIGDTLWRAIDFHRSGRRGLSQKTAFILRGLSEGHLSNEYPWILNDGFIAASRASVRFEVLANDPNSIWEVSSEEEEVEPERRVKPKGSVARLEILRSQGAKFLGQSQVLQTQDPKAYSVSSVPKQPLFPPPAKAAVETTSVSASGVRASGVSAISSSSSGVAGPKVSLPKGSNPSSLPKGPPVDRSQAPPLPKGPPPKRVHQQPLAPRVLLPDSVECYSWSGNSLVVTSTRNFAGTTSIEPQYPAREKFLLVLDWYQTLSRSTTASAEAIGRVPQENLDLLRSLKDRFRDRLIIVICSYISGSEKNLTNLLRCCEQTEGLRDLVPFIFITRQQCGPEGKYRTIQAINQGISPTCFIDDNAKIIEEATQPTGAVFTVHLKLRRKPSAERSYQVHKFLEDCQQTIEQAITDWFPNW